MADFCVRDKQQAQSLKLFLYSPRQEHCASFHIQGGKPVRIGEYLLNNSWRNRLTWAQSRGSPRQDEAWLSGLGADLASDASCLSEG